MAKGDKGGKYNKSKPRKGAKQPNRDKDHDRYGRQYDRRTGTWTERDCAEEDFGRALSCPDWIIPERANAELAVLNFPRKKGPPFKIAPCVVFCFVRLKSVCGLGYRTATGLVKGALEQKGVRCPTYSSACKLATAYCGARTGMTAPREAEALTDPAGSYRDRICVTETAVPQDVEHRGLMTVRVVGPSGPEERSRVTALDSTGLSTVAGGLWSHSVWGTEIDGWVRVHSL
jgi:hypothetical protein